MLNRANLRATIFHKDRDYDAFVEILLVAAEKFDVRIFHFCLMPNHWHLCLSLGIDGELGWFGQWFILTHTQRHHAHYRTAGQGHLYQGRFKSFPVQDDEHFLTVARYVERSAFAAKLCEHPGEWRWGSLHHWADRTPLAAKLLSAWPVKRPANGADRVAEDFSSQQRRQLDWSVKRGVPFGGETWVESIARRFNLESTMRPRGRPRKFKTAP